MTRYCLKHSDTEGLAWIVRGSMSWYATRRVIRPNKTVESVEQYRKQENPVIEFVEERLVRKEGCYISNKAMWKEYQDWLSSIMDKNKHDALTQAEFTMNLKTLGCVQGQKCIDGVNKRRWFNVKINKV